MKLFRNFSYELDEGNIDKTHLYNSRYADPKLLKNITN